MSSCNSPESHDAACKRESHALEAIFDNGFPGAPAWKAVCECGWEVWNQPGEIPARSHHGTHVENAEEYRPSVNADRYDDGELREPRDLSDRRLFEIVQACLSRWHAYPTIPGGLRHARNGTTALIEIERRLRDVRP